MSIEPRYYYNYAWIDPETNQCLEVRTTTADSSESPNLVPIPVYSYDYIFKYYNRENGKWYLDAEMQNEWIPPTE